MTFNAFDFGSAKLLDASSPFVFMTGVVDPNEKDGGAAWAVMEGVPELDERGTPKEKPTDFVIVVLSSFFRFSRFPSISPTFSDAKVIGKVTVELLFEESSRVFETGKSFCDPKLKEEPSIPIRDPVEDSTICSEAFASL
jgi:hypothetical protein